MTSNPGVNSKILDRVRKLLALAADGGATQAEAELAAERARQIMAEHGITNATVEASGGQGEGRVRDGRRGHVGKRWMRDIMRALAEQSFVTVDYQQGYRGYDGVMHAAHWELWGRESAVATTKLMHEYLVRTVDRVARERGTPTDETFKEAMGTRIAERVSERHQAAMAEQAREARERRAAASHPSSSTSNALVVVLEDYAQKERDLNEDMRLGLEPGTTARQRLEREQERELRQRERQREIEDRERRRAELEAEGVDPDVIEYVLAGIDRERAEACVAEERKPENVAKRREQQERDARRSRRQSEDWQRRFHARMEREQQRMSSPSYRAGRRAGDDVGLDAQVGRGSETKKIGG